jgi:hypothetical protein
MLKVVFFDSAKKKPIFVMRFQKPQQGTDLAAWIDNIMANIVFLSTPVRSIVASDYYANRLLLDSRGIVSQEVASYRDFLSVRVRIDSQVPNFRPPFSTVRQFTNADDESQTISDPDFWTRTIKDIETMLQNASLYYPNKTTPVPTTERDQFFSNYVYNHYQESNTAGPTIYFKIPRNVPPPKHPRRGSVALTSTESAPSLQSSQMPTRDAWYTQTMLLSELMTRRQFLRYVLSYPPP